MELRRPIFRKGADVKIWCLAEGAWQPGHNDGDASWDTNCVRNRIWRQITSSVVVARLNARHTVLRTYQSVSSNQRDLNVGRSVPILDPRRFRRRVGRPSFSRRLRSALISSDHELFRRAGRLAVAPEVISGHPIGLRHRRTVENQLSGTQCWEPVVIGLRSLNCARVPDTSPRPKVSLGNPSSRSGRVHHVSRQRSDIVSAR